MSSLDRGSEDGLADDVSAFLHDEIRPMVQVDGGDLVFEGLAADGRVTIRLRGDCTRCPAAPKHLVDCVRGKKAVTEWRVLERKASTTRLALFPKTGRSHQLRVHMESIGHPIVGDPIYGHPAERLMLHAQTLEFRHPVTGDPIRLECPPPF